MRDGVLFEITKDHLETGLHGFPAGYCATSHVDPKKGFSYIGRPIADLSLKDPIEIIYLLLESESGRPAQIAEFSREMAKRSSCKKEVLDQIKALPTFGDPLRLFSISLLIAGIFEETGNYREDCLNAIAKLPQIVATLINSHARWGDTPEPNTDLGYIENFLHMLCLNGGIGQELSCAMRLFNVLNQDPGGAHLSAFTGKVVASGLQNMYGCLASSMIALSGLSQANTSHECLAFIEDLEKSIGAEGTEQELLQWMEKKWEEKDPFLGFGHPAFQGEDSRASAIYSYCQKHFPKAPLVKMATLLRSSGTAFLKGKGRVDPFLNFDAMSAVLLKSAGFAFSKYYSLLAAMANCIGISIQIMYERTIANEGRGAPMLRPMYLYKHRI